MFDLMTDIGEMRSETRTLSSILLMVATCNKLGIDHMKSFEMMVSLRADICRKEHNVITQGQFIVKLRLILVGLFHGGHVPTPLPGSFMNLGFTIPLRRQTLYQMIDKACQRSH